MFSNKVSVVGVSAALALSSATLAGGTFDQVNLGLAGPSGLGLSLFITGPKALSASNSGTLLTGNVGLASGASTNFSGGGSLTGILYKDPGATTQGNLSQQFHVMGGVVTTNLAQAVLDVQSAWSMAMMLTPDTTLPAITNNLIVTSAGGTPNGFGGTNTTVKVNGDISLSGGKTLTVQGSANDWFIVNVLQNISLSGGSKIQVSGGIPASHVLFVLGGNQIQMSNGNSLLTGTFLAPNSGQKIQISPGSILGSLIGYEIQTSSGPQITGSSYQPPIPAPGAGVLLGLTGLVAARRRRAH